MSEVKCWDYWIQWTLRNSLHYISCDLRELRRVFLSCELFWNINTNMSHTLITCSPFSLVIFESLVLERFVTLSSIWKFCCFFQHNEMLCEGLDLGNAEIPKGTSVNLCCLLFPLSFWISEFFTVLFLAVWCRFCSVTHPLVQFIGRPALGL